MLGQFHHFALISEVILMFLVMIYLDIHGKHTLVRLKPLGSWIIWGQITQWAHESYHLLPHLPLIRILLILQVHLHGLVLLHHLSFVRWAPAPFLRFQLSFDPDTLSSTRVKDIDIRILKQFLPFLLHVDRSWRSAISFLYIFNLSILGFRHIARLLV